jgi:hypothetical protein
VEPVKEPPMYDEDNEKRFPRITLMQFLNGITKPFRWFAGYYITREMIEPQPGNDALKAEGRLFRKPWTGRKRSSR